jgi:hypothetical protein
MNPLFRQNVTAFLKRSVYVSQSISFGKAVNFETCTPTLLPKEQFRRMLLAEKKRAERADRNLLLMLIDRGKRDGHGEASTLLSEAAGSLSRVIRDTDITGWFEVNRVLGVMFTEFGDCDLSLAAKVIESKVTLALQQIFTAEPLSSFNITFYAFPDNWVGNGRTMRMRPQVQETQPRSNDLRELSAFSRVANPDLVSKVTL